MTRPLLIGLTGPIGCGKSTIGAWLREAGGVVIDADEIAHAVTLRGEPALERIRKRFGSGVLDRHGRLDRGELAKIVFDDPGALADLEAIVHPPTRERIDALVARAERDGARFVVIEAIKLVEAGYPERCDEVWLVECTADSQRERLKLRNYDTAAAERRIATQGNLVQRLAPHATRRISTDGSPEETRRRVDRALSKALEARP